MSNDCNTPIDAHIHAHNAHNAQALVSTPISSVPPKAQHALKNLRQKIDALDASLALLLQKRSELVGQIATLKKANNLPVLAPQREHEILNTLPSHLPHNASPQSLDFVRDVFVSIIEKSRNAQDDCVVLCDVSLGNKACIAPLDEPSSAKIIPMPFEKALDFLRKSPLVWMTDTKGLEAQKNTLDALGFHAVLGIGIWDKFWIVYNPQNFNSQNFTKGDACTKAH